VHILDISPKDAQAVAAEISSAGGTASAHACDVGNQAEVATRLAEVFERDRIHILVNNAGISHIGNAESTPEADFDRVMRVNVKGFYNCIHATVGHMKANGGGVILNMASVAGSAGLQDRFA
jgi:2-keto-3-deoxy-L-fuconate dehydrogenase